MTPTREQLIRQSVGGRSVTLRLPMSAEQLATTAAAIFADPHCRQVPGVDALLMQVKEVVPATPIPAGPLPPASAPAPAIPDISMIRQVLEMQRTVFLEAVKALVDANVTQDVDTRRFQVSARYLDEARALVLRFEAGEFTLTAPTPAQVSFVQDALEDFGSRVDTLDAGDDAGFRREREALDEAVRVTVNEINRPPARDVAAERTRLRGLITAAQERRVRLVMGGESTLVTDQEIADLERQLAALQPVPPAPPTPPQITISEFIQQARNIVSGADLQESTRALLNDQIQVLVDLSARNAGPRFISTEMRLIEDTLRGLNLPVPTLAPPTEPEIFPRPVTPVPFPKDLKATPVERARNIFGPGDADEFIRGGDASLTLRDGLKIKFDADGFIDFIFDAEGNQFRLAALLTGGREPMSFAKDPSLVTGALPSPVPIPAEESLEQHRRRTLEVIVDHIKTVRQFEDLRLLADALQLMGQLAADAAGATTSRTLDDILDDLSNFDNDLAESERFAVDRLIDARQRRQQGFLEEPPERVIFPAPLPEGQRREIPVEHPRVLEPIIVEADVDQLIRNLGDEDVDVRDAAMDQLVMLEHTTRIGSSSRSMLLEKLTAATTDRDLERAARAKVILNNSLENLERSVDRALALGQASGGLEHQDFGDAITRRSQLLATENARANKYLEEVQGLLQRITREFLQNYFTITERADTFTGDLLNAWEIGLFLSEAQTVLPFMERGEATPFNIPQVSRIRRIQQATASTPEELRDQIAAAQKELTRIHRHVRDRLRSMNKGASGHAEVPPAAPPLPPIPVEPFRVERRPEPSRLQPECPPTPLPQEELTEPPLELVPPELPPPSPAPVPAPEPVEIPSALAPTTTTSLRAATRLAARRITPAPESGVSTP